MSLFLELLISLVFIYALLSAIVSGINELIVYALNKRGKFLKEALGEVLNDKTYEVLLLDQLYSHPGVDLLKQNPKRLPAYISAQSFAKTIIDLIATKYDKDNSKFVQDPITKEITMQNAASGLSKTEKFKAGLEKMEYSDLKVLLSSINSDAENLQTIQSNLETWYNDYMDRVAGWYKSALQKWLLGIAICVSLALNVDSIAIVKFLAVNDIERQELVLAAEQYVEKAKYSNNTDSVTLNTLITKLKDSKTELQKLPIPIGWYKAPDFSVSWFAGLLITSLAISFGSPIWFELLNKLINLRKAGKKPETTPSNPS